MTDLIERAAMSAASINNLPDSDFAYIEPGGAKDSTGKTTPRSLRHFPIHDAAHVRNALARAPQSPFGEKAMPKILAAAKKFGIDVAGHGMNSAQPAGESFRSVPFEVRSAGGDGLTLEGYAAVYNSPTRIDSYEGRFDEVIERGAFNRALSERTPVLMFEHGKHPLIGTMPLGVITRTSDDERGLHIEARLSDNWLIQPVRDAVRDGAVKGMSFRFSVDGRGDNWQRRSGQVDLRTIREFAAVPELGPVVFPAYEPTTAAVRSLAARGREARQLPAFGSGDDVQSLALAADTALDAVVDVLGYGMTPDLNSMSPEQQKTYALLMAADASIDALLQSLGVYDAADMADTGLGRSTSLTARPTRGVGGGDLGTTPGTRRVPSRSDHARHALALSLYKQRIGNA